RAATDPQRSTNENPFPFFRSEHGRCRDRACAVEATPTRPAAPIVGGGERPHAFPPTFRKPPQSCSER
ncbi:hypothetical protein GWI33_000646, partial [Rhynchophorus ferrugineus]